MSIPDSLAALVAYLKTDSTIMALTGGRIYGDELPESESASMPRSAVVIQDAGGSGSKGNSRLYLPRVDVRTYGPTAARAKELQMACHLPLLNIQRQVVGNCFLHRASLMSGPFFDRENSPLFWPYYFSVWSVATTYNEVTN